MVIGKEENHQEADGEKKWSLHSKVVAEWKKLNKKKNQTENVGDEKEHQLYH